jgi:hypothetical protein
MLLMVEKSPDTLMASWRAPEPTNGIISNYTIRCLDVGSNVMIDSFIITDVSTLSTTLGGLTAFTNYECTISASTGAGKGNSSDPQSASTDEDGGLCMTQCHNHYKPCIS